MHEGTCVHLVPAYRYDPTKKIFDEFVYICEHVEKECNIKNEGKCLLYESLEMRK